MVYLERLERPERDQSLKGLLVFDLSTLSAYKK
jgi:hypothetical protein